MWDFINEIIKNPFFGVATGLLGYVVGNRLSIGRDKRKEFNAAASDFREAFAEEIVNLSKEKCRRPDWSDAIHGKKQTAQGIISAAIEKHTTAYTTFRHYIGYFKLRGFDTAWVQYTEPNKSKIKNEQFLEYESLRDPKKEKEIRETILHRIKILLKYAKPK